MHLAPKFATVSDTPALLSQDIGRKDIESITSFRESKDVSKSLTGEEAISSKIDALSDRDTNSVTDTPTYNARLSRRDSIANLFNNRNQETPLRVLDAHENPQTPNSQGNHNGHCTDSKVMPIGNFVFARQQSTQKGLIHG
ncbi:hypothetical protein PIB30_064624 [Stylosanthes scabra]|uniref:Uncharacterized protein n=1 Tax=Stylosanthes scabra TaxID=79078 RepID=A0ABU6ULS1_9FABA|nr:hypothetical protein [Stylosanthes scabra]